MSSLNPHNHLDRGDFGYLKEYQTKGKKMNEEEKDNFNWDINELLLLIAKWNANHITYDEFVKSSTSKSILKSIQGM